MTSVIYEEECVFTRAFTQTHTTERIAIYLIDIIGASYRGVVQSLTCKNFKKQKRLKYRDMISN